MLQEDATRTWGEKLNCNAKLDLADPEQLDKAIMRSIDNIKNN
jgi:hypothetical protein